MSFETQHMSLWLHTACETSSCIRVWDQTESGSVTFMSSTGWRSSGSTALLQIYRLTNVLNKMYTCPKLCMSVLWWLMCVKYGITAKPANDFQRCLLQPCGGSDWSILNLRKPWRQDYIPLCLSSIHFLQPLSIISSVTFSFPLFFPLQPFPFPLSVPYHISALKFLFFLLLCIYMLQSL